MRAVLFSVALVWWIRQLLNALLRPVFCAAREAGRSSAESRAQVLELRFLRLLNAADCYPFCVQADRCGLWIMDRGEAAWWDESEEA